MSVKGHNKLVRDKIPTIILSKGETPVYRGATPEEYDEKLRQKLGEEIDELLKAKTRREKTEELADVLEVLRAFASENRISFNKVEEVRVAKRKQKGGFSKRYILHVVSTQVV